MRIKIFIGSLICFLLALVLVQHIYAQPKEMPGKGKKPLLEKRVFIHYKKGFGKPADKPGGGKAKESSCYGFLSKDLKWKNVPQQLLVDADNSGVLSTDVLSAIASSADTWDDHTQAPLFSSVILTPEGSWDSDSPDGKNELVFDNYYDSSVIAVTITWGYFNAPPPLREIVEFDILFNTQFNWAINDPSKMDIQNIATHEIGHGLGLNDQYETICNQVTMYGYSDDGEIIKQTLEEPDIEGLHKLYGM